MYRSFLVKGSNVPLRLKGSPGEYQAEPSTISAVTGGITADRKV
jgi:hypothetical protein